MKELLYEGKAKKVWKFDEGHYFLEFKDSLTAFNALKKGSFQDKGHVNRDIAALIFEVLKKNSIPSHYVRSEGETGMVVKKVEIVPLEVVVRNRLAGSTAKKFGIEEGKKLAAPLVEFYYKNDELQDPFMSDDQIFMMEIASSRELEQLKSQALAVNKVIKEMFFQIGIDLIDFKIEFGRDSSKGLLLADEITPDCCRLWDMKTGEKMDKDRFRRDLGGIQESYNEVLKRLKEKYP